MRVLLAVALALGAAACSERDRVDPRNYDAFWLWPGVSPPAELKRARIIYLLDGEIRDGRPAHYVSLRPQPPHLPDKQLWLVVRANTLDWPEGSTAAIAHRLDQWRAAGNGLEGLQVDFDARTRHLEDYAAFLRRLRAQLPKRYRLSVTGLLDWSANGDPRALAALAGTVDEVVLQTYQGRETIPGYEAYFRRLGGFPIPFRVGLVDFDARTRLLQDYATFLARLRAQLPKRYRLSVTGLLDWSANGDPRALAALAGTVDEVVLQTYQGRETIPGYEAYFRRLGGFPIPFRVGLVEGGRWREPPGLARNPRFNGYVVFLLEPRRR